MTTTAPKSAEATPEERVAAGAAWLDRIDPKWMDRLDVKSLDLRSNCDCVLGQIVGTYNTDDNYYGYGSVVCGNYETPKEVKAALPKGAKRYAITRDRAKALGFHIYVSESHDDWDKLTRAWKRLIKARKAAAGR